MNQGRAKSIFSCAQPFSITIIVSGLRCITGTACSAARRTRVYGSECDSLSPPVRVWRTERGTRQVATKLPDRLTPAIGLAVATVLDRRLRWRLCNRRGEEDRGVQCGKGNHRDRRARNDVALTELNSRSTHVIDNREVEIQRDDLSVGSNVLSHPR